MRSRWRPSAVEVVGILAAVAALLAITLAGCADQVPGRGPTCAGPPWLCESALWSMPRLDQALAAEGFTEVRSIVDVDVIAGEGFELAGATSLGDRWLCGTNHVALTPRGVRCAQRLGYGGLCGDDSLIWAQPHEHLHCAARFSGAALDGDPGHEDCGLWGDEGARMVAGDHPCRGAPPGVVQRLRAALAAAREGR